MCVRACVRACVRGCVCVYTLFHIIRLDINNQDSDFDKFQIIFNLYAYTYIVTATASDGWKEYTKKKLHIYM